MTNGLRARGNFHRLNTIMTKGRAERSTGEIASSLRMHAGSRKVPAVTNYRNVLFDLLVHTQDITIPLGLDRAMPVEAARDGASRVWAMGWPFWAKRRLKGLRLAATDVDWAVGSGEEVRATISDLLLLLTGRPAAPGRLAGPGLRALTSQLAHDAAAPRAGGGPAPPQAVSDRAAAGRAHGPPPCDIQTPSA